uniref:hypothetical protein n=1 Tax=Okeania sp. SIO2F4 TaxID=2607790 RepID=UPI0025D3F2CA|nr:hypothetical protein [Okeania sp. SIO2F4]
MRKSYKINRYFIGNLVKRERKKIGDKAAQQLEEINEQESLYATATNPKFDFLKDSEEDIYSNMI